MKIEEAKEKIEKLQTLTVRDELINGFHSELIDKSNVLNIINQLDQQKLVVPQMIFDVIENFDEDVDYLHEHMGCQSDEVREWLTHNERDFYEAWLAYPNITVEKEKLYTVEIPTNSEVKLALVRSKDEKVVITIPGGERWRGLDIFQLTEQEIRKDFDWAWQQKFQKEVANEI